MNKKEKRNAIETAGLGGLFSAPIDRQSVQASLVAC